VQGVPIVRQRSQKDCGAAALAAVLEYWGKPTAQERISAAVETSSLGIRAGELQRYAESAGLKAFVFNGAFEDLTHELQSGRPAIVGMAKPIGGDRALAHYEIVVGYHPKTHRVLTIDPAEGLRENTLVGFMTEWQPTERLTLVVFEH
jgi:ABC-type bacteriocin/lantibiotic exporter with double-glycine peptidase domain